MNRVFWRAAICISTLSSSAAASSAPRSTRGFFSICSSALQGACGFQTTPAESTSVPSRRSVRRQLTTGRRMSKLDSPSAERNKDPIWQVLKDEILPNLDGELESVLEIAAGTGIHALYFSNQLLQQMEHIKSNFRWQPADADQRYRESIQAYINDAQDPTLKRVILPPLALTLNESGILEEDTRESLSGKHFDLLVNINMIHIAPVEALYGLVKVASEQLQRGGFLLMYGPYKVGGKCVESNQNFDASLRQRDPRWGIRELDEVKKVAEQNGLAFVKTKEMPANNLVVLFRKQ